MAPSQSNIRNELLTHTNSAQIKTTPTSKSRCSNNKRANNNPLPMFTASNYSCDHPVEVVGRIRDFPNRKEHPAFELVEGPNSQETNVRVKTETGYRDFSLDGISMAEKEDLSAFFNTYIEDRVYGTRTGKRCTIIMYGPTGTGKSHTMFGSGKEPGIVYRALHCILGGEGIEDSLIKHRLKVKVSVLEIYNEEIFDLLSTGATNNDLKANKVDKVPQNWQNVETRLEAVENKNKILADGFMMQNAIISSIIKELNAKGSRKGEVFEAFGFPFDSLQAKLEVIGKRVKNATSIYGSDAGKITKEVAKVEKRRVVKSSHCNERSSRSHCLIVIDVPEVGGRLVLVDMAGSENMDQAGSVGSEAKMQTGKINQGNVALKRVVESIANGDSHVPYRDSKLTMLLQDSFEDDGAKLLMVLCASPDPRDIHKTVGTLEYGAKAKCIVRLPSSPPLKVKTKSMGLESVMLRTRILAMDEYILKLQAENKLKEQERQTMQRKLQQKEEEVAQLRIETVEMVRKKKMAEAETQLKVEETMRILRAVFTQKCEEYECKANDFMELEYLRMEKCLLQLQRKVEMLCKRLEEIDSLVQNIRSNPQANSQEEGTGNASKEIKISPETCLIRANEEAATISMVLNDAQPCDIYLMSEIQSQTTMNYNTAEDRGQLDELHGLISNNENNSSEFITRRDSCGNDCEDGVDEENIRKYTRYMRKGWLPTVYEEEKSVDEEGKHLSDGGIIPKESKSNHAITDNGCRKVHFHDELGKLESSEISVTDERRARLENIFLLCGNYREIARKKAAKNRNEANQISEPVPDERKKVVEVEALTPSPRSASNDSSLLSQKSIRSIGLDCSINVSPSARLTSTHLVTLSPSTSPTDLTCLKRPIYGDETSGSNEVTSLSVLETTQDQLKEMIHTDASSNGLSSCSALTEIKSLISSCCQDKSRIASGFCIDGEDDIQSQHHRSCDVYVKWEASSHEISGKLIGIINISKDAFLKNLRKMIELNVQEDFIFLTFKVRIPICVSNYADRNKKFDKNVENQDWERLHIRNVFSTHVYKK
ncbi:hypothetical protein KI387_011954 [Taxus chinensis]|uniref:Kinesin motor domain-containing protein n=1 Tax=Taxus chinensis TaxID=29808 RepID=A0AA38FGE6_TAXCH|nr:hypothetical protein KI387_011954 [Taxus chinensis]